MRYLVLVSHGTFAPGLHSVLRMLGGERADVLSASLEDGMSADAYVARLKEVLAALTADDEVVLLGDIIGGSPLTNALNVLAEQGLLAHARAFGGMNLPMAMTALMGLATQDLDALAQSMLTEAHDGARELQIATDDADDDEEDDI
ncbi:MAG TPA: PTS fructose transporter subunit IIA [Candidatus Coprousia avicola]|nr:PTS fructose transporter subunit IIA [Candidatus Coprousia avicola]